MSETSTPPGQPEFSAINWQSLEEELFNQADQSGPEADEAIRPQEALTLRGQVVDRLPDLIHRHPYAEAINREDQPDLSDAYQVSLAASTYPDVFTRCNLADYDQIYVATGQALMGPEVLIEARLAASPDSSRFFRLSPDRANGLPEAGHISAATGQEDAHPLAVSDALFAHDVLQALDITAI